METRRYITKGGELRISYKCTNDRCYHRFTVKHKMGKFTKADLTLHPQRCPQCNSVTDGTRPLENRFYSRLETSCIVEALA